MDNSNRRDHFRVELLIPVKWRILNNEEIDKVKKGQGDSLFKQGGMLNPIDEYLEQTTPGSTDEQMFLALQFLNNKIDFIIEQILLKTTGASTTHDDIIELSASGLKFATIEKLDIGTFLKMELIMPGVIQYSMELIAEVLRIRENDDGGGYINAARIICIKDDSRDSIIKMVFQKQRSDIRNNRKNLEEVAKID